MTRVISPWSPLAAPGPLHANAVASLIGAFPVIVPPAPGVLCATGEVCCDYREEFARTVLRTLEDLPAAEVEQLLQELGAEAAGWLEREGIARSQQESLLQRRHALLPPGL